MFFAVQKSCVGLIGIVEESGLITELFFNSEAPPAAAIAKETQLLQEACRQLDAYFNGRLQQFSLPLAPRGTPFQQRVWRALQAIPYGETMSYKEVAVCVGQPKAARAVGMANNRNPIPIIIPCHRVIGADGQLVGYGSGLPIKIKLLTIEGAACVSQRQ